MHIYACIPPSSAPEDEPRSLEDRTYACNRGGSVDYTIENAAFRGYGFSPAGYRDIGLRLVRRCAWITSQDC
jgi:hypothetical protein